jgi:hypothetical protein
MPGTQQFGTWPPLPYELGTATILANATIAFQRGGCVVSVAHPGAGEFILLMNVARTGPLVALNAQATVQAGDVNTGDIAVAQPVDATHFRVFVTNNLAAPTDLPFYLVFSRQQ